jgi:hypothetical protein
LKYHTQHKKKIRGWKRHKRKIDRWKQNAINLDLDNLAINKRDYEKLLIHPFYGFERNINPPRWYCELLLEAMLDVYDSWNKSMKSTNKPYYLKLWIYNPNFINSQIVVAYKNCINFYDSVFEKSLLNKEFPYKKSPRLKERLKNFEWNIHFESKYQSESDWIEWIKTGEATKRELDEIRKKANHVFETKTYDGKPDIEYVLNIGDVWVGSLK